MSVDTPQEQLQVNAKADIMPMLLDKTPLARRSKTTGFTPAGNAMIDCVTYPPCSDEQFNGFTSAERRNCTQLTFRTLDFNPLPASVNGANVVADPQANSIGYLIPSGMRNFAIGVTQSSFTGTWDLNYSDVIQNTTISTTDTAGITKYNQTKKSYTFYGNMTAFNDIGSATVTQFRPSIIFAGTFSRAMELPDWQQFVSAFLRFNGKLVPRDSDLWDEAASTLSKLHLDLRKEIEKQTIALVKERELPVSLMWIPPDATFQVIDFGAQSQLVPTISEIVQSSARVYNGTAKEGAFVKMRPCNLDPQSIKANNLYHNSNSGLYQCYFHGFIGGAPYYNAFVEPVNPNTSTPVANLVPLLDTLWDDNFNWAWVIFTGLSPNLTAALQTNGASGLLLRKGFTGFEVQPSMTSPYSATVRESPMPDFPALERLTQLLFTQPDGEPARNNFLGAIARVVGRAALPRLKQAASQFLQSRPRARKAVNGVRTFYNQARSAVRDEIAAEQLTAPLPPRRAPPPQPQRPAVTQGQVANLERQLAAVNLKLNQAPLSVPRRARGPARRRPPTRQSRT